MDNQKAIFNQLLGLGYASEVDSFIRNEVGLKVRLSDYVDENSDEYSSDVWYKHMPTSNIYQALCAITIRLIHAGIRYKKDFEVGETMNLKEKVDKLTKENRKLKSENKQLSRQLGGMQEGEFIRSYHEYIDRHDSSSQYFRNR